MQESRSKLQPLQHKRRTNAWQHLALLQLSVAPVTAVGMVHLVESTKHCLVVSRVPVYQEPGR
jgi:hypothetical protein